MDRSSTPSNQLTAFCKSLNENNDLQSQIQEAKTAKQIIAIAALNGHEISFNELRIWSKELKAHYFPWAEMGNEWRRNFFKNMQ